MSEVEGRLRHAGVATAARAVLDGLVNHTSPPLPMSSFYATVQQQGAELLTRNAQLKGLPEVTLFAKTA